MPIIVDLAQALLLISFLFLTYNGTAQNEIIATFAIIAAAMIAITLEGKKRAEVIEALFYMITLGLQHIYWVTSTPLFGNAAWVTAVLLIIVNAGTVIVPIIAVLRGLFGKDSDD